MAVAFSPVGALPVRELVVVWVPIGIRAKFDLADSLLGRPGKARRREDSLGAREGRLALCATSGCLA